jgi:hypothetical protein
MNNTDFFRIRTFSLNPVANRANTKEVAVQKTRPIQIHTNKGIQSLLEGSSKSHCNTFVGYSRIPHKYDHFHEKTLPSSAAGSFVHSLSPKKPEPQKDLLLLSETLDVNQAKLFFNKQKIYNKVFDIGRFSRSGNRPRKVY